MTIGKCVNCLKPFPKRGNNQKHCKKCAGKKILHWWDLFKYKGNSKQGNWYRMWDDIIHGAENPKNKDY